MVATERLHSSSNPSSFTQEGLHSERDVQISDHNLSSRIVSSIRSSIRADKFKKSVIEIAILILSDDGGLLVDLFQ